MIVVLGKKEHFMVVLDEENEKISKMHCLLLSISESGKKGRYLNY